MLHKFRQTVKNPVIEKDRQVDLPPKPIITKAKHNTVQPDKQHVLLKEEPRQDLEVHRLGDVNHGSRVIMHSLGIDIGTKNVVLAYRNGEKTAYLREVNGFYVYPNPSKFVENMLDDPSKERSDGTKRPARWIKLEEHAGVYVLGADAEELAYAHNDTLLRPMAHGGIAQEEDAMMVLAAIVQGLLDMAENEVGEFDDKVKICYCTTAASLNGSTNVDYHKQVVDLIIEGYESKAELLVDSIKESHAIVLKESEDGTGIGISWGAGTVTVSYVLWGQEIYSFSWVGAGDWIDTEVAMRHGYDPDKPRRRSRETPTTVCRTKERIDLSKEPTSRLDIDIVLHYKILIQNVVRGIVQGFIDNENQARIDKPITVYMAGGTSSPRGFEELVETLFGEESVPFTISGVKRCKSPIFAVAEGCLMAAEMQ